MRKKKISIKKYKDFFVCKLLRYVSRAIRGFSQLILHEADNPKSWENTQTFSFDGQTKKNELIKQIQKNSPPQSSESKREDHSGFLSGCCLGKSRAERPSVSKATMKRDTTAIISHFLATKKLNMRGPSAQSREDERARKQNGGRGSPGNTLDRRQKGEKSFG